jgi:Holliday junction resolvase RusA-like endonuclease
MIEVEFTVYGDPASQAGMRTVPILRKGGEPVMFNGRPLTRQITEGSKGLKSWRQEVSDAAHMQAEVHGKLVPPIECWMEWHFLMPASRPKWAKVLGLIPKITKPDGDKLQRAVWDSLKTGGLIPDDANITNWHGAKVEVSDGWIGVRIKLRELPSGKPVERLAQPALVP